MGICIRCLFQHQQRTARVFPADLRDREKDSKIESEAYKAILTCHDKLVTAIATDHLNIAGSLLAKEFISGETYDKMLLLSLTSNEKAAILVTAVREKIKLAPQRFQELVKLFSEHSSSKYIVKLLQSAYQGELIAALLAIITSIKSN